MTFIAIAQFALGVDLAKLASAFSAAKIPYRIFERDGQQVVVVIDVAELQAKPILAAYQAGVLPDSPASTPGFDLGSLPLHTLLKAPVTIVLITLSILGFALVGMQWWGIILKLLFQPTFLAGSGLNFGTAFEGLSNGEVWRLITPMFLHFGVLHLVFNCLWCWEFGRRIEVLESSQSLLVLVLITGVSANIIQYAYGGAGMFGGLSGVVFGLLAYYGISEWLQPSSSLALNPLNPLIYVIMLVFLVLGMSGLMSLLGLGAIANAAHVGGLLSGAIWALIVRQFNLFS